MVSTYGVGQYSAGNASDAHVGCWGRGYKTGGRAFLWSHFATTNATDIINWGAASSHQPFLNAITGFGPIMGGDFGGDSWGNDAAQSMVSDAWSWVKSQYGAKTDKAILIATSMGGLLALNWARANPTLVAAILLCVPCVNLQAQHDGTGGAANTYTASIETAYGGLAAFNTAAAAHDPAQHAASYTGIPIRMYYASNDTTVGTANQTAFATAVGGSAFSSVNLGAVGHADHIGDLSIDDVVGWAAAYA